MPVPAAIRAQMKDTVTVKTMTNVDGYGNKVLSAGTAYRARVEYGRKRAWAKGEEVWSDVRVYIGEDVTSDVKALAEGTITLPDAVTETTIKDAHRLPWPTGGYSFEIIL